MGKSKYNWQEVQAYYDNGHSLEETAKHFGMQKGNLSKSRFFTSRTISEQRKMAVATRRKNDNYSHSAESKQKLSDIAIKRGFGGKNYRKTFEYKGTILESSYELKLAKELDNHGVLWIRPKRFHWIDSSGKQRHYTPDFYLIEYDIYLDPKNDYLIKIDSEKVRLCSEQNNVRIVVLSKQNLSWQAIKEICGIGILVVS